MVPDCRPDNPTSWNVLLEFGTATMRVKETPEVMGEVAICISEFDTSFVFQLITAPVDDVERTTILYIGGVVAYHVS